MGAGSRWNRGIARSRQEARRLLRRLALRPGRVAEAEGRREELSMRYLRGEGIEIGALHRPLWVPSGVQVRYVDFMPSDALRDAAGDRYGGLERLVAVDVVDDGGRLAEFSDAS